MWTSRRGKCRLSRPAMGFVRRWKSSICLRFSNWFQAPTATRSSSASADFLEVLADQEVILCQLTRPPTECGP